MDGISLFEVEAIAPKTKVKGYSFKALLLEYTLLKLKFEKFSDQSWYFKKGADHNRLRLKELESRLNSYFQNLESRSINDFVDLLIYFQSEMAVWGKKRGLFSFIEAARYRSLINNLEWIKEMVWLKTHFSHLKSIEDYMHNKSEFYKLMQIEDELTA